MKIVLRDQHTATEIRRLVVISHEGGIRLDGWDLGDGVAAFWGAREYEWTCDVGPDALPRLVAALGGSEGDDIFEVIRRSCSDAPERLYQTIKDANIPHQFWSRVGD